MTLEKYILLLQLCSLFWLLYTFYLYCSSSFPDKFKRIVASSAVSLVVSLILYFFVSLVVWVTML